MQKLLSVIIPSYNSGDFVETAIESVLLLNSDDVEIIVVNDGSTDNTDEVLKRYSNNKSIIVETISNHGTGYARNFGFKKASGKWIAYLDADDTFIYGTKLLGYLRAANDETEIIYAPRAKTNFDLSADIEILYPETAEEVNNKIPRLEFWTGIYNAGFLRKNNIKFYEYRAQDIESAFRYLCFSRAKNIKIENDLFFILQRVNVQSNTHTWNIHKLNRIKALVYFDLFETTPFEEDKEFLFFSAFNCIKKYAEYSLKNGIEDKADFSVMKKLRAKMGDYDYPFIPKKELKRIKGVFFKLTLKNKKFVSPETAVAENLKITNEEAIKRLKEIKIP